MNDESTGLKSSVYERKTGGKTEYSYVTAGTQTGKDVVADLAQPLGLSKQYAESVSFAQKLGDQLGDSELTMVGYSKGGGEAAADAMGTGRSAVTFNPAGVSGFTKSALQLNFSPQIDNYDVKGEILGNIGLKLIGLGAEGTQHSIGSSSFLNSAVQALSPAVGIYEGMKNHFMTTVSKAMSN